MHLLLALFECLSFGEDEQYSVPVHPGRRVIITHRIRPWVMIARRLIIRRDGVLPRVPLTSRGHSARNWEGARGVYSHYHHAGAVTVPAPIISELHSWLRSCLVIGSGTEGLAFTGRAARKKTSIKNYPNPSGEAARGVRG